MNKTNDFKYNLPAYSDPVDIEDLNDNFRGIDDALMAGLCKKDYTGNNMGSSDPSARKYAWAPWLEIVNDNEFDVVVTDRNAPVGSEEATINIAAGQTFRKYINGRYYMNFYVQDQHDVTFKWFTDAETYINESGGGGGGTGTVTSVSVQGGSGSHLTGSGNPIETSGTITINVDEGYSIPSDNEQTAWDGKAADLKFEINSSTFVITAQLKDSSGNLIGNERTIDLPLESVVVSGDYDEQTKKVILTLQNGSTIEFSVADLVSGLQTELNSNNKLNPDYIAYDASHRAVSDTEKGTWNAKQNAIDSDHKLSSSLVSFTTAEAAALASGIDSAKVAQISTNQSNILSVADANGQKNLIFYDGFPKTEVGVTLSFDDNGGIELNGTCGGADDYAYIYGIYAYVDAGTVYSFIDSMYTGSDQCAFVAGSEVFDNPPAFISSVNNRTAKISDKVTIVIRLTKGITYNKTKMYPMLCAKSLYDISPSYQPYALPNYDLTRLEAEDRAALVEEIDAGAKNKFNLAGATITTGNASYTISGNAITVTSSGTWAVAYTPITLPAGDYVLDLDVTTRTSTTNNPKITIYTNTQLMDYVGSIDIKATGHYTLSFKSTGSTLYLAWYANQSGTSSSTNTLTVTNMLMATKAAFGVSNKFVPYRPNYDLVCQSLPCVIRNLIATSTDYTLISALPIVLTKVGIYRISAFQDYSNTDPRGIIISRSSSDYTESIYVLAKSETSSPAASLSTSCLFYHSTTNVTNLYFWAKAKTVTTNQMGVVIEYLG